MGIIRSFIKWVKGPAKKPINVDRVQTPYVKKKREEFPMTIKRPVGRPKGSKGIKKMASYKERESTIDMATAAVWMADDPMYIPQEDNNNNDVPTTTLGGGQFGGAGASASYQDDTPSPSYNSSYDSGDSGSSDCGGGDGGGD